VSAIPLSGDPLILAATSAAKALLCDLPETRLSSDDSQPRPAVVTLTDDRYRVTVRIVEVRPISALKLHRPLTECEHDILDVLSSEVAPMTTIRVEALLESRRMFHGEATVKRGLARLVREESLVNYQDAPRGYQITDAGRDRVRQDVFDDR
jgi:hypothetical protein